MESVVDGNGGGSRLVVTELSHIKELVKQLDVNLGGSPDLCKNLAAQIITVTEKSISMIRSGYFDSPKRSAISAGLDSPPLSATPSPLSGVSDMPFFKANKKRKTTDKQKHRVRVSSAGEAPEDDGYSWRKYGQKDILGAHHPRGYYRCTYQKSQGCAATKQVQRADEDPTLYDVIYNGGHTCVHKSTAAAAAAKTQPEDARRLLQSLSSSLKVETEGLTPRAQQGWSATTPFSFSSPAVSGMTPSTPENYFGQVVSVPTSLEPSPVTSDSNHFPTRAQCEFQTMVSALMTAASMPPPAMEDEFDFDFDVSSFFA